MVKKILLNPAGPPFPPDGIAKTFALRLHFSWKEAIAAWEVPRTELGVLVGKLI